MRHCFVYTALLFFVFSAAFADEWIPTMDEMQAPLALQGLSPRIKFVKYWADKKGENPKNHFPSFKSADASSHIQYCTINASSTRLECSTMLIGPPDVVYERDRMNIRIAGDLKAETGGAMSAMYLFTCRSGCSDRAPKMIALMIYDGGD